MTAKFWMTFDEGISQLIICTATGKQRPQQVESCCFKVSHEELPRLAASALPSHSPPSTTSFVSHDLP